MTTSRTATVPSVQAISLRERSCRIVRLVIRFFFFKGVWPPIGGLMRLFL